MIFLLFFLNFKLERAQPAPFLSALYINLFPSFFLPLIAKNKLSFLINLVSIEIPLKLTYFIFPKIFLKLTYFE